MAQRTRQTKLRSGRMVTEVVFDEARYDQACRRCGGNVKGAAIWYCREVKLQPAHVECPANPVKFEERRWESAPVAPKKSLSVYAERREEERKRRDAERSARRAAYGNPPAYVAGGLLWEDE